MTERPPVQPDLDWGQTLVQTLTQQWKAGADPDAAAALRQYPELAQFKDLALQLIFAEHDIRQERGECLDPSQFRSRFPDFRSSVSRMFEAVDLVADLVADLSLGSDYPWPQPGDRIDDLVLLRVLGQGGLARVYLAREESAGNRPVVIKVTPRLSREGETLGKISHPNIAEIYWVRQDESRGETWLCMPFRGTATLEDALNLVLRDQQPPRRASDLFRVCQANAYPSDPAPLGETTTQIPMGGPLDLLIVWMREVADALAYLHSKGVVHSDLKPSNILLTPSGRAMVIDFNLAEMGLPDSPKRGGTLMYMAPEQLANLLGDTSIPKSPRSDIYAFGLLLYELFTGFHPFPMPPTTWTASGPAPAHPLACELLQARQHGREILLELAPVVGARLASLVADCLEVRPERRPTAEQLRDRLGRFETRWTKRVRRFVRRRPKATIGIALSVCLSIPLLGAGGWEGVRAYNSHLHETNSESALAAGQFREAIQECNAWLELDPTNSTAHARRASASLRLGREELLAGSSVEAVDAYTLAINVGTLSDAELTDAHYERGRALVALGRYDEAFEDFSVVINWPTFGQDPGNRRRDGLTLVYAAFSARSPKMASAARGWGKQAIDAGFSSAAVRNNFAYHVGFGGGAPSHKTLLLRQAQGILVELLNGNDPPLAARYNFAMTVFELGYQRVTAVPEAEWHKAVTEMGIVLDRVPQPSEQLLYDAARIAACWGRVNEANVDEARHRIESCYWKSARLGFSTQRFASERLLEPFFTAPSDPSEHLNIDSSDHLRLIDPGEALF